MKQITPQVGEPAQAIVDMKSGHKRAVALVDLPLEQRFRVLKGMTKDAKRISMFNEAWTVELVRGDVGWDPPWSIPIAG